MFGKHSLPDQFKRIIKSYKRMGYNMQNFNILATLSGFKLGPDSREK